MIPRSVAHYRILEEIGRGGMGVVYRAEDTRLHRLVALKCLSPKLLGDAQAVERFMREARSACALNHPNIVTVYDAGVEKGTYYIATELVEGQTLRALLKQGLAAAKGLEIAKQILEALRAAHQSGIAHRDLKPENVMVRSDGYVKVLDFGLAKVLPESPLVGAGETAGPTLTAAGQLFGTLAYMSPEQALGQPVDHRSDLFSFGLILYEVLTGKHPWPHGSAVDTLHAVLHDEPPPLPDDAQSIPTGTEAVVRKALQKNPRDRYPSAEALLKDISSLVSVSGSPALATADLPDQQSLAVLPFVFLSPVAEKESLSLGFADALITSLGNLEDFVVPPTSAILKYAGGTDPLAVSQELRVRHVLQGNIQKLGPRWRVSIQLYDAQARKTAFSEKYDFALEDVFEIQDQIGRQVAQSLQGRFRSATPKTRDRYSTDPYAYDEFVKGLRDSFSDTSEVMEKVIEHLTRAVELDPEFGLAHAALSRVLEQKYFIHDSRRAWAEKAEFHCRRALELDSNLPEGHLARAHLLWSPLNNFQHREAIVELQKALSLHPNLDGAHTLLGLVCTHIGRLREAEEAFDKSLRVRSENPWKYMAGQVYLWAGKLEEAVPQLETWLRASPGSKYALWLRPQPPLFMGDLKSANKLLSEALERDPDEPLYVSLQGVIHALQGEAEPALECVRRACEAPRSFGHSHHTYYQIASVYALLEETTKAMDWLERSVNTGFACWPFFQKDPALKNLQPLPEFQSLVKDLESQLSRIPLEPH